MKIKQILDTFHGTANEAKLPETLHLLTTKRQWTYGPTQLPWNDHFHTSLASSDHRSTA